VGNRIWSLASLLGLGAIATTVLAEPVDDFRSGVSAFQSGNFDEARRLFVQARDGGLHSPTLLYNLGSTYYRLGRFDDAAAAFGEAARDPAWTMLARYNLGLVAWEQGDRVRAAGYFSSVARQAPDPKLVALALAMWERVDPLARWMPRSRFAVNLGYDSNVVLSNQPETVPASGKSDFFTEIFARTGAQFGRGTSATRWEVSLYDIRYFDLSEYNLTQIELGLAKPWVHSDWTYTLGGQWRRLWLDGSSFQQIYSAHGAVDYSLGRDQLVRTELRYNRIDALDNSYSYLDGQDIEAGLSMIQAIGRSWLAYGVSWSHGDRDDLVLGSDYYSYSPDRLGAWIRGTWPIAARWSIIPSARYRISRYGSEDRHGGMVQTREDQDWQAGIALRFRWLARWGLNAEYQYSGLNSNFDEFSYSRHVVQLGVNGTF